MLECQRFFQMRDSIKAVCTTLSSTEKYYVRTHQYNVTGSNISFRKKTYSAFNSRTSEWLSVQGVLGAVGLQKEGRGLIRGITVCLLQQREDLSCHKGLFLIQQMTWPPFIFKVLVLSYVASSMLSVPHSHLWMELKSSPGIWQKQHSTPFPAGQCQWTGTGSRARVI